MSKRVETIKDYKRMGKKELSKLLAENREKMRQMKFELSGGKIKNVREIRRMRRDIARILTLLNICQKED